MCAQNFFSVVQTLDNALLLWGSGGMLSDPDAKWGSTWDVRGVCLCVCDWINSPAVSLRTDHINDRTEACAHRLLIKERAEEEMEWGQTVEDYETEKKWTSRTGVWRFEKQKRKHTQKQCKIEQQHDSAPAGQLSFLSPPLLALSSSFLCLFLSPHLSLWDQDYFSPLTLSQWLWHSLPSKLLLILTPQPTLTPPVLLSWTNLDFTLWEEGHPSISCVVMDREEEEEEGRGEESIWLVNFNAKADVSMYLWAQWAGSVSFYVHTGEYL